jgi:hypothetical protein
MTRKVENGDVKHLLCHSAADATPNLGCFARKLRAPGLCISGRRLLLRIRQKSLRAGLRGLSTLGRRDDVLELGRPVLNLCDRHLFCVGFFFLLFFSLSSSASFSFTKSSHNRGFGEEKGWGRMEEKKSKVPERPRSSRGLFV